MCFSNSRKQVGQQYTCSYLVLTTHTHTRTQTPSDDCERETMLPHTASTTPPSTALVAASLKPTQLPLLSSSLHCHLPFHYFDHLSCVCCSVGVVHEVGVQCREGVCGCEAYQGAGFCSATHHRSHRAGAAPPHSLGSPALQDSQVLKYTESDSRVCFSRRWNKSSTLL